MLSLTRRRLRKAIRTTPGLFVGDELRFAIGGGELRARFPEERYYGQQRPGTVQIQLDFRGDSIRVIVPAAWLRSIADIYGTEA